MIACFQHYECGRIDSVLLIIILDPVPDAPRVTVCVLGCRCVGSTSPGVAPYEGSNGNNQIEGRFGPEGVSNLVRCHTTARVPQISQPL